MESNSWRGIRKVWHHVSANLKWEVRDGLTARFWTDVWIGDEPLINSAAGNISEEDMERKVRDYDWNWPMFNNVLSTSACMMLAGHIPPSLDGEKDLIVWRRSRDNRFSVSSAYHYIHANELIDEDPVWKLGGASENQNLPLDHCQRQAHD